LLQNFVAMSKKPVHITSEEQLLCDASKHRQRSRKCEPISHLGPAFTESGKEVIMLHELESTLDHCVLKIVRRIESRNLAGKVLTHAKVFGSPPHKFVWTHESRPNPVDRLLTRPLCSQQMHFNTAGKVKASLNGHGNLRALFDGNHQALPSAQVEATKSPRSLAFGNLPKLEGCGGQFTCTFSGNSGHGSFELSIKNVRVSGKAI
jgi:hypothetical protein